MKLTKLFIALLAIIPLHVKATTLSPIVSYLLDDSTPKPLAFVGAEGFGAKSVGGRGGKVYHITNLNDSGSGSFRACAQASEARICMFDIGGTIVLDSSIAIESPYISIVGQSVPKDSGGITLRARTSSFDDTLIKVHTHDVIMRYMRLRRGPMAKTDANGVPLHSAGGDNLTMGHSSKDVYNIIIDHCSISWGFDENIDTYLPLHDITIQYSISSEALHFSSHNYTVVGIGDPLYYPGHSKGSISFQSKNVSLHHNLYASNEGRNPRLDSCDNVQMNNLIIYNWGGQGGDFNAGSNMLENSLFIYGPSTNQKRYPISMRAAYLYLDNTKALDGPSQNTLGGLLPPTNTWDYLMGDSAVNVEFKTPPFSDSYRVLSKGALPDVKVHYESLTNLEASLLPEVGAAYIRDSVDERVINTVTLRSGSIIDDPSEVGGWPNLASGTPIVDSDSDGIPDTWEKAKGLDFNNPLDAKADRDGDGYSNLEEYLEDILQ